MSNTNEALCSIAIIIELGTIVFNEYCPGCIIAHKNRLIAQKTIQVGAYNFPIRRLITYYGEKDREAFSKTWAYCNPQIIQ